MAVDRLGMAGGWNPNVGFASHMGKRPDWFDTLQAFKQDKLPGGMMFAGAADGALSLADVMASGEAAARRVSDTETEIGRAHVCIPVSNRHLVFRLLLVQQILLSFILHIASY